MVVYLFQTTVVFSILYLVYKMIFSRLTFHFLNRWFLVLIIPISLILPLLIQILPPIEQHPIEEIPQLFEHIAIVTTPDLVTDSVSSNVDYSSLDYMTIITIIYLIGIGIGLFRFCLSLYRLYAIKKQSSIIQKDTYSVYEAPVADVFSYLHWIFIPKGKVYDPLVITHEKAHIQLRHTLDILLVEVYIVFFWWNPFVYLYRKSLKSIHEYQADHYVLSKNVKTSDYLQLIAHHLTIPKRNHLYSYFHTPILKKRIQMMTKKTSHYRLKIVYVLLIPICVLCMVAFTKPTTKTTILNDVLMVNTFSETPTASVNPTFVFPIEGSSKEQITALFDVTIKDPKTRKTKVHTGIDIRASIGTPIIATADGTVLLSKKVGAWGNLLKLKHENGYETWYAHLKDFEAHYGQSVKKGTIIGYVGMTGNTTGPHLHYELRYNKKSLNPLDYLKE
ncbi:M23/M56 family metallopeptidase [uncultured Dokdonia sp.]|uniref:M23/M56 family metallopeptidase n=1 Tax=uncultured Dokdonia sp. TaxID=575653 RepID=UPI0026106F48|nr:M23/M56 family metallopeptidase [uncultured Dokdonia sp.]